MRQHLVSQKSALGVAVEHRGHKVFEEECLLLCEAVLSNHDVLQTPILEFRDSVEVAFLREILPRFGSSACKLPGEPAQKFHHLREMVVVFPKGVVIILARVEEQLARQHFEGHAGQ